MRNKDYLRAFIISLAVILSIFAIATCLHHDIPSYNNAGSPLVLKNAYGDSQGTHVKVISFDEPWNGYSFWLTDTPYLYADDKTENPHIFSSNDMIHWEEPDGYSNPLEPEPEDYMNKVSFYSDPHLVYNSDLDRLECWWRYLNYDTDSVIIYRKWTTDGVHWTEREAIQSSPKSVDDYVSLSPLYEDGIYKIWTVGHYYRLRYWESADGTNWEHKWEQYLKYDNDNLRTWHIDMIHTQRGYEGVVVAFDSTIEHDSHCMMSLYYMHSDDNQNFDKARVILSPRTGTTAWDNWGIYRSSLLYYKDNYYLFYAAIATTEERMVGLISGPDVDHMNDSQVKIR